MRIALLAFLCMTLFATNSLFCRAAVVFHHLSPWQYTSFRGLSAALMLVALSFWHLRVHGQQKRLLKRALAQSSWPAAFALFGYMACFSLAYLKMPAAMGTLIFNACIQFTILGFGVMHGTRLSLWQNLGLFLVVAGLLLLTLPKVSGSPPLDATLFAIGVGFFWGVYSILGRSVKDAVLATAGNFFRCVPLLLLIALASFSNDPRPQSMGLLHALMAGALATALGYVLWYHVVPRMSLVNGSIIQLTVPIITAVLAALTLDETITWHLILSSICILGGISLVIVSGQNKTRHEQKLR
ncbi:MAG: DMT family transporter [Desulfovibrio sp.]|nr:DMT family transporter [Desulfovibrio sp.]